MLSALFSACSDDDNLRLVKPVATGELNITFDAKVGNTDFALNKDFSVGNQTLNFTKLRYWISNIVFVNTQGAEYVVPDSYFLMEEVGELDLSGTINDKLIYPANKRETFTLKGIPAGEYKSVKFAIGVDSRHNDNLSLRAGELSIANGMSSIVWMWHSSYIFSSLAGSVRQGSETKTFKVETGLNANYKTMSIEFTKPVNSSTTKGIVLNVDVTKILDGINLIKNPAINATTAPLMSAVATNQATKAITFSSAVQ
jgi:hypothetical protein